MKWKKKIKKRSRKDYENEEENSDNYIESDDEPLIGNGNDIAVSKLKENDSYFQLNGNNNDDNDDNENDDEEEEEEIKSPPKNEYV